MSRWMIFLPTKYEYRRMFFKIIEITSGKLFFSIPTVDMETPPHDKASMDPPVAADMQVEEDEERADVNNSTEE